jgi:TonB family protein
VNPAARANRDHVADQYLWQVVRKLSQYLPDLRVEGQAGRIGLRLVIARDGRLLEASIAQSSGHAILDRAMLETARAAAPYAVLPAELGDRITLNIPLEARR